MTAASSINELRGDPEAIARSANAAFDHICNPKLLPHPPKINILAAILKRRIARDNEEVPKPRQLGDDVLGDTVAEILLVRVSAHIGERKDCNGRSDGLGSLCE